MFIAKVKITKITYVNYKVDASTEPEAHSIAVERYNSRIDEPDYYEEHEVEDVIEDNE